MGRLHKSAYPGDSSILVETNLDWVAGEKLAIAPTTMRHNDSDYAVILSYTPSTGVVVLDRQLTAYHYGTLLSTATTYGGVDIRGEVFLLSRNIYIKGDPY
jgi:chaperone required for assembly of F1-ATPase